MKIIPKVQGEKNSVAQINNLCYGRKCKLKHRKNVLTLLIALNGLFFQYDGEI